MPIIQQVKKDAEFLRNLISNLKYSTVIQNGVELTGEALEEALETVRAGNRVELQKLELILQSGIVPEKYYSIITHQEYHPSDEERKKMLEPLPSAQHTFFVEKNLEKRPNKNYRALT